MSIDLNVNVYHYLDLSISVRSFVMGLFDDLSAQIAALKQATSDEHTEVMDAIAAAQTGVTADPSLSLTADQKTQINAMFDDLKTTIQNVHDASATTGTTPPPDTTPPTGTTPPIDPTTGAPIDPTTGTPTPTPPAGP
jgi:hypothetical protein